MNKIFYISILLFVVIFSLLLLSSNKEKWAQIQYTEAKNELTARDTLKLLEWVEGNWERYPFGFNQNVSRNEVQFHGDTVDIRLKSGFYILDIQIIGNQFTSTVLLHDHMSTETLLLKKQELILENFALTMGKKLKGEIYCEAKFVRSERRTEKVKIKGYFEMNLVKRKD